MKKISNEVEKCVIDELKNGISYRKIAQKFNISFKTVGNIAKRSGLTFPAPRLGRNSILSVRDRRTVQRLVASGEANGPREVQQKLSSCYQIEISKRTALREINKCGFHARKRVKKPRLTERHKSLRLAFAKKYQNWTMDDWEKVIWTDESKINLFGPDGPKYIYRKPNAPSTDRDVIPTMKFGGGKLLFWGCFCVQGVGKLHKILGNMNAEMYIDIIKSSYMDSLTAWGRNVENSVMQQDNDPKHKAKKTLEFFETAKITLLDWPPQSPDLNPIENLWGILKRRVYNYQHSFKNTTELWQRCHDIWSSITQEECRKLVESMPFRIQAVIESKGGYTKY